MRSFCLLVNARGRDRKYAFSHPYGAVKTAYIGLGDLCLIYCIRICFIFQAKVMAEICIVL